MRYIGLIAAVAGLALLTGLTAYYGFDSVIEAVVSSRWGTALVVVARAVVLATCGVGWWLLLTPAECGPRTFVGLRFVREGINALFPFTAVGGDVIGARLLAQFRVGTMAAIASVLVDIFMQVTSLFVFVLAGIGIAWTLVGSQPVTRAAMVIAIIAVPAVTGFFITLNFGAYAWVSRRLVAFGEKHHWARLDHLFVLGDRLQQIWRSPRGLSASFVVHVAAVFLGAAEVWIALHFMGHGVSPAEAVAIESLGQGSRGAAFMLPGGLGVQDGTLIAASAIFGVPAEIALAMALIKRVPDLVLGTPALFAWQVLEGRQLLVASK